MDPLSLDITPDMRYETMPVDEGLSIDHLPAVVDEPPINVSVNQINAHEVHKGAFLGMGAYGRVCEGKWRDRRVAIKCMENRHHRQSYQNEVAQLARVSHPNIVDLYGVFDSTDGFCIALEFMEDGSLYDLLHGKGTRNAVPYNIGHAISWMQQAASAVMYLHNMKPRAILHRDLKPGNMLLSDACRVLKLADFGTATEQKTQATNMRGSAPWMAPEVFSTVNYTEKCDVFSLSICMWEVLSRRRPYANMKTEQPLAILWNVHTKNQRPEPIEGCPVVLETLMIAGWASDPADRPSVSFMYDTLTDFRQYAPGGDEPIQRRGMNSARIVEVPLKGRGQEILSPVDGDMMTSSTGTPFHSENFLMPSIKKSSFIEPNVIETDIPSLSMSSSDIRLSPPSSTTTTHRRGGSYDTALIVTNTSNRPGSLLYDTAKGGETHGYSPDTERNMSGLAEFQRPLQPISNNAESQQVFNEHTTLVRRYAAIKHDIADMTAEREKLMAQIKLRQDYDAAVARRAEHKNSIEYMQRMVNGRNVVNRM